MFVALPLLVIAISGTVRGVGAEPAWWAWTTGVGLVGAVIVLALRRQALIVNGNDITVRGVLTAKSFDRRSVERVVLRDGERVAHLLLHGGGDVEVSGIAPSRLSLSTRRRSGAVAVVAEANSALSDSDES